MRAETYAWVAATTAVLAQFLLWTALGLRHDLATAIALVLVVMTAAAGPILVTRRLRATDPQR